LEAESSIRGLNSSTTMQKKNGEGTDYKKTRLNCTRVGVGTCMKEKERAKVSKREVGSNDFSPAVAGGEKEAGEKKVRGGSRALTRSEGKKLTLPDHTPVEREGRLICRDTDVSVLNGKKGKILANRTRTQKGDIRSGSEGEKLSFRFAHGKQLGYTNFGRSRQYTKKKFGGGGGGERQTKECCF